MNNRDELDGLMMLPRAMSGETDVIEHMEAEEQPSTNRITKVAKRMTPSREEWEQLGFVFTDIPGDDVLCSAVLPEGWSVRATGYSSRDYEIIDENGMKRGRMFYEPIGPRGYRTAHMNLQPRYSVCSRGVGYATAAIYFGNDEEILFVAGQIHQPANRTNESAAAWDKLCDIAKQFGDENYPDWENVHAYWDKEKEISIELPKYL